MSNSLKPDQTRHLVGPDLGPNCLQKSSENDIDFAIRKRVNGILQTRQTSCPVKA